MPPVQSMTGYGQAEAASELGVFLAEIKSVNHRFLEARVFLPRNLAQLELPLTRLVKDRLARGKVDVSIRWTPGPGLQPRARFNQELFRQYRREVGELLACSDGPAGPADAASADFLLALPGVIEADRENLDDPGLGELAAAAVRAALDALIAERGREGAALQAEILGRLGFLDSLLAAIEEKREAVLVSFREKLLKKAEEWARLAVLPVEPGRLESEVLLYAERSDITEELVRLRTHLAAFRAAISQPAPGGLGKSLEFLAQELLREANTIASKSRDTDIATAVLGMKNELEKIREQILNLE